MDTSTIYIDMCEKAQEIQRLISTFHIGVNNQRCFAMSGGGVDPIILWRVVKLDPVREVDVWLPRQDQLQYILKDHLLTNLERQPEPYKSLHQDMLVSQLRFIQVFTKWCETYHSNFLVKMNTMEQFWLCHIMYIMFNKYWNVEEKNWACIEYKRENASRKHMLWLISGGK